MREQNADRVQIIREPNFWKGIPAVLAIEGVGRRGRAFEARTEIARVDNSPVPARRAVILAQTSRAKGVALKAIDLIGIFVLIREALAVVTDIPVADAGPANVVAVAEAVQAVVGA